MGDSKGQGGIIMTDEKKGRKVQTPLDHDMPTGPTVSEMIQRHMATGTGSPSEIVQSVMAGYGSRPSPDAIRQLEDVFGPFRREEQKTGRDIKIDYDDVVQQSFPASDPPPPPG